jgi:hypothetical protein
LFHIVEMVFDLENELDTTRQMPSREAIEHPVTLHSSRLANRKQTAGSKPQSPLDSVPGSSPLPSLNVVDGEPHETVDPPELVVTEDAEEYAPTPHEAEILKLVAADVPSHRGAWRVDGPAWQVFFSRTKPRGTPARDDDDTQWQPKVKHEDEDDDDGKSRIPLIPSSCLPSAAASQITQTGIPGSMPITIHMRNRPKEAPLSLASYRPQPARPETTEAPRISRRDVYAERENARALDPGVLAFMLTEEDEEEVEQEVNNARSLDEHQSQSVDHGDRGRVHALKILEARSALPEPGNPWRSSLA